MDGHNTLKLLSLTQLNLFFNILQIWTLILLLNKFWQEWSRLVSLCNELLYIINFDLYTVCMNLFETTEHNVTCSHVIYIWTLILLLNTFCHEWSRLVTHCNELLYIICFDLHTLSMTPFDAKNTMSVSHFRYISTLFILLNTFWHEWSRIITLCNELIYYKVGFDLYTVYMTLFDAS
jgi:hypothetical protein